jgi:hypothetical protein
MGCELPFTFDHHAPSVLCGIPDESAAVSNDGCSASADAGTNVSPGAAHSHNGKHCMRAKPSSAYRNSPAADLSMKSRPRATKAAARSRGEAISHADAHFRAHAHAARQLRTQTRTDLVIVVRVLEVAVLETEDGAVRLHPAIQRFRVSVQRHAPCPRPPRVSGLAVPGAASDRTSARAA